MYLRWFWCGLCLALACLLTSPLSAAEAPRPNIVIFLCDDLGYGDLGCFGHPTIKTPVLDQLARDGLRLTSCYSAAPVCSPSRAGLITGRTPTRLGIHDWIPQGSGIFLKQSEATIPKLLKQAGYATAHVGKWHLNSKFNGTEPTPGDHGFDYWFSTQNNAGPSHRDPQNFVRNGKRVGPLTGYSSALIVDEGLRWLETVPADKPFALFVWFHAPHEPIAAPEEFTQPYADKHSATEAIYFGSVTMVDHEIGRMLAALDKRGVRDETLVMFTSDNGPETLKRYPTGIHSHGSAGPLRGMKLHLHEGGYRVPGILRWPQKIAQGQESAEPVSGVDLLPTLCELAGVPLPQDVALDGASFVPVFTGNEIERRTPLYWQYDKALGDNRVALRDGKWKLLTDAAQERMELYDLAEDPGETKNLAELRPDEVKRLRESLSRKFAEVNGDPVK